MGKKGVSLLVNFETLWVVVTPFYGVSLHRWSFIYNMFNDYLGGSTQATVVDGNIFGFIEGDTVPFHLFTPYHTSVPFRRNKIY